MRRTWHLIFPILLVFLFAACQKNEEIPTIAPKATVPVPPSPTPIPPTVTPASLKPRYDGSSAGESVPQIEMVYASTDVASSQNPALVALEIATLKPLSITLEVSRIEDDGRILLIDSQPLQIPGLSWSQTPMLWSQTPMLRSQTPMSWSKTPQFDPGIHEHLVIWGASGAYLSDGLAGGFVKTDDLTPGQLRVIGRHRAYEAESESDVHLIFDTETGALAEVVNTISGLSLDPQPGDSFQTQITYLEDGDIASIETGTLLIFDENGQLTLEQRPLPDGRYQLNFYSPALDSVDSNLAIHIEVSNENLPEGQYTYIHPIHGYQFRLPDHWPAPTQIEGRVYTEDLDSSLNLSVTSQPGMEGTLSSDFREQVLEAYGDVQILYEEAVSIGEINTTWTAYGYESSSGPRTGVFLAIVRDGWGHVIDMEGLASDEEILLGTAGLVVDSLAIRSISPGDNPGKWEDTMVDGYVVSADTSFLHDQSDDVWHRFIAKDGASFIAIRKASESEADSGEMLERTVSEVTAGRPNLSLSDAYHLVLGDRYWDRIDYSYAGPDALPKWGFIMIAADPEISLVAWAESTPENLHSLEQGTFFPMLVDIKPSN
ncbi:MAG TPA: hypothetical protein VFI27_06485 [candidate division Zixibacteria bacterium]|nr:hypothetical protein [candidate division Zixibacteria bacterium]